jgi:hypothetical protein
MDGARWLAELFEPALERETLAFTHDGKLLRAQLRALHDCGVLTEHQYADAERRLTEAVDAAHERARFDVRPAGAATGEATTVEFRKVLAIGEPLATVDGMPFLLTSVEVWSNRIDLMLACIPTAESDRRVREHEAAVNEWLRLERQGRSGLGTLGPPFDRGGRLFDLDVQVRDDAGTTYQSTGGSAGGSSTEWRLHRHYAPGPPAGATELTVELRDDGAEVEGAVRMSL